MADLRFYDNRGPLPLAELCAAAKVAVPTGADGKAKVRDIAGLREAGPEHISLYGHVRAKPHFAATQAGWCLAGEKMRLEGAPKTLVLLPVASVAHAHAAIAARFYPVHEVDVRAQKARIHHTARLDEGAVLGPGAVIGPGAEIGAGARIGANVVIGRGVTIGRDCEISANVTISYAYLGDQVVVQPGAQIGGAGFGFASSGAGHVKIPQLGRVIVQDRVELGSNSTIARGALGDTVIGEGTKIDNLVHIGHNTVIGRHVVIAGCTAISGSCVIGDFVFMGGMCAVSDHVTVGDGARLAGRTGVAWDLPGGHDYGGVPARPIRDWHREVALLDKLVKNRRNERD